MKALRLLWAVVIGCSCAFVVQHWVSFGLDSVDSQSAVRVSPVAVPWVVSEGTAALAMDSTMDSTVDSTRASKRASAPLQLILSCGGERLGDDVVESVELIPAALGDASLSLEFDTAQRLWVVRDEIAEGRVALRVRAAGFIDLAVVRDVDVGGVYQLELTRAASIVGRVVDATGQGLSARVSLELPGHARRVLEALQEFDTRDGREVERVATYCDDAGFFTLAGVPPGDSYTLSCTAVGALPRTVWLALEPGLNPLDDIELVAGNSLNLSIDGWRGARQQFQVAIYHKERAAWIQRVRRSVDPGVVTSFAGLPMGSFRIIARRYLEEMQAWEVVGRDVELSVAETDLALEVECEQELAVSVTHPEGGSVAATGVTILHHTVAAVDFDKVQLGESGELLVRGIPDGWISIIVSGPPGFGNEQRTELFNRDNCHHGFMLAPAMPKVSEAQQLLLQPVLSRDVRALLDAESEVRWAIRHQGGCWDRFRTIAGKAARVPISRSFPHGECQLFAAVDGRWVKSLPFVWPHADPVEVTEREWHASYQGTVQRDAKPAYGEVWLVPHVDGSSPSWIRSNAWDRTRTYRDGSFEFSECPGWGGRAELVFVPAAGDRVSLGQVELKPGKHELGVLVVKE